MNDIANKSVDELIKLALLEKLSTESRTNPEQKSLSDKFVKAIFALASVVGAILAIGLGTPKIFLDNISVQKELLKSQNELMAQKQLDDKEKKERNVAREKWVLEKASWDLERADWSVLRQEGKLSSEVDQKIIKTLSLQKATTAFWPELNEALKPRIYIQFAGETVRKTIDGLREAIKTGGFNVPGAERINRGQGNEVRYFTENSGERERAERVAALTEAYFKKANCPLNSLKVTRLTLPDGKPSPIELWLNHSCNK